MATPNTCLNCGAVLTDDARQGYCPKCLFRLAGVGTLRVSPPDEEEIGTSIGRYKLLEKVGEGGFGAVYVAEQREPVKRRVALKIIKLGMDTKAVIARFEAERQALALMEHPNIAKVLDGGATDTGRPYFVMELVRGMRITDYCDQNNLSTEQRLGLFMQVCHAIQHAHQKGIIHRDVKPSNILVTILDGQLVPKVIDFGIAKATQGQLTDKTVYTQLHQFIGTPAYMSPEQAALSAVDVDTRSDVYSLGVLLYELLTGHTPFDAKALRDAGLDEMRRLIREKEPPRPSTRISTLDEAERTTVAKHRQAAPATLTRLVRGDLDWIVMKCLEKERSRRYETANALALDIEHHLSQEPVSAVAPSAFYRFRKFVRRNRLAAAAVVVVFSALALGLGVATWMFVREREAFREQTRLRLETEKARAAEAKAHAQLQTRFDIIRVRDLVNEKKYSQAEELLNKIEPPFRKGDSTVAKSRRALAWQWMVQRRWDQAADRLAALITDDGTAWSSDIAVDHFSYANILVYTGRGAEYENWRRSILTQFATNTSPDLARFLCEVTMLAPASEVVGKAIARFYDLAQMRTRYPEEGVQSEEGGYQFKLALTDYRLGNFQRAARLCDRTFSLPQDRHTWTLPRVIALRAMAHHQLHEDKDARLALAFCHQIVDPAMETGPSAFDLDKMGAWMAWVRDANLQREADALIGPPSANDYARLADARAKLGEAEKFGTNRLFDNTPQTEHDRARQIAAESPPILQRTEGKKFVNLLKALGLWELQHHQWRLAVTNWDLIVYGPSGRGGLLYGQDLSSFYLSFAPLLVQVGDEAGYERSRTNALATFAGTSVPVDAARILQSCLLRPPDEKQMPTLKELATVLTAKPGSSNALPAGDLTLALYQYRSGDPTGALASVRTNLSLVGHTPALAARAGVLSAMCLARIGRLNEARAEIDSVRETIENKFSSPPISRPADLETWHEWWVDHILLEEAQASLPRRSGGSGGTRTATSQ